MSGLYPAGHVREDDRSRGRRVISDVSVFRTLHADRFARCAGDRLALPRALRVSDLGEMLKVPEGRPMLARPCGRRGSAWLRSYPWSLQTCCCIRCKLDEFSRLVSRRASAVRSDARMILGVLPRSYGDSNTGRQTRSFRSPCPVEAGTGRASPCVDEYQSMCLRLKLERLRCLRRHAHD
jgi:hypothetical protein